MFTSLNLKPVLSARQENFVTLYSNRTRRSSRLVSKSVNCGMLGRQSTSDRKGRKKCNVYCCTIFSNKRTQKLFCAFSCQNTPLWFIFWKCNRLIHTILQFFSSLLHLLLSPRPAPTTSFFLSFSFPFRLQHGHKSETILLDTTNGHGPSERLS